MTESSITSGVATPGSRRASLLRRLWHFISRPSTRYSLGAIAAVFFVLGVAAWITFDYGLSRTETLSFCIGCHEMQDTVYQEYKETVHYSNRSGVRAACPDCHTQRALAPRLLRHLRASLEVWATLTGEVNTKEKFEAKRMEMATREWARMKEADSATCRSCHDFAAMSADAQKQTPYRKHMEAKAAAQSCIDCHKGIAHHLPKEYRDPNEM
jgi:cytochrome c-type protein NapC